MAIYAVGDVQGCDATLRRLLKKLPLRGSDRIWFAGDLVNRGPKSADVLRRVMDLGDRAVSVLGNHDLHLLSAAWGVRRLRGKDTLRQVIDAKDGDELLDWLEMRPLVHADGDFLLVHAGLFPSWTPSQAARLAREAEAALRAEDPRPALLAARAPGRISWRDELRGERRLAAILGAMTRMRYCTPRGVVDQGFAGPPEDAPRGLLPWFEVPGRRSTRKTVVFGHWASLGLLVRRRIVALDTGCVWGGPLTAVRLEDGTVFQEACRDRVR